MNEMTAEQNAAKDRLLSLADRIENLQQEMENRHYDSEFREDLFCMRFLKFNCGSPACIVGHYSMMFNNSNLSFDIGRILTYRQPESHTDWDALYHHIVCPHGYDRLPDSEEYTPQKAANMLRNFVKTGTVDWEVENDY